MDYSWNKMLGDIPGALPIAVLTLAFLDDVFLPDAPKSVTVPLSAVMGLGFARLGSVWDHSLFDSLYSRQRGDSKRPWFGARRCPDGTWEGWLADSERPFALPPGRPLNQARGRADMGFKSASEIAKRSDGAKEVRRLEEVSKVCRALILPFMIGGVATLIVGDDWTVWGVVFLVVSTMSLVGFLHFRVDYMTKVYELAVAPE